MFNFYIPIYKYFYIVTLGAFIIFFKNKKIFKNK